MKQLILPFFVLLTALFACQENKPTPPTDIWTQIQAGYGYDSTLAQKMGGNDYGMREYVLAILKKGPNRNQDSATAAQLQKAHMESIGYMANKGKLIVAGPFLDTGEVRGIYIFDVKTIAEVQRLTQNDPAIKAGRLAIELHPWYGSAALPLLLPLHKRLEKPATGQ